MTQQFRSYVAELLGTLILVFVGGLSVLAALRLGGGTLEVGGLVVVAFGFGLALLIGLYAFGEVSGGHFNPAVSLAMLIDGRLKLSDFIGYVVSQVGGAVIAAVLLAWASSVDGVASTATVPGVGVGAGSAFVLETALTAFFVMAILNTTVSETFRTQSLTAISLAFVAIHLAGYAFTGASVNPARTLGPALVGGTAANADILGELWIYLVAPFFGAVIGWAFYRVAVTGQIEMNLQTE